MDSITKTDVELINNLSARKYTGNKLNSNSSLNEQHQFNEIKSKLKAIANFFSDKYKTEYGPFQIDVSRGNPITRAGTLNYVWSTFFKGASNKQYAAQISFVMNRKEPCIDVGFYFGRASRHDLTGQAKEEAERKLQELGVLLSSFITSDGIVNQKYDSLFDVGFKSFSNGNQLLPNQWLDAIRLRPGNSQIVVRLYPNSFGIIELSSIDFFVSKTIFLMAAIIDNLGIKKQKKIAPLTLEQRAKEAERFSEIGQKGENYVMACEAKKLIALGIDRSSYPKHVSLESMHYGYDILSLDENMDEIFIEVKTTTRVKEDLKSRYFFLSSNEYRIFLQDKNKYKLYRVYDVENIPSIDVLNLDEVKKSPDGYIVEY